MSQTSHSSATPGRGGPPAGAGAAAEGFRCGYISIVGRPNTGKSSLFNALLRSHLSGVSPKRQTTRTQVMGWLNMLDGERQGQLIFLDTPGLMGDDPLERTSGMRQQALGALEIADVVLMMIDARSWLDGDDSLLRVLESYCPASTLLLMNKVDLVKDKSALLPLIEAAAARHDWAEIIPISVLRKQGLERLLECIWRRLPLSEPYYSTESQSLQSPEEIIAEHIREKVYQFLHKEIPYRIVVRLDRVEESDGEKHIYACLGVRRSHQRAIVIGKGGRSLALIRRHAEGSLNQLFEGSVKVFVHLEVAVAPASPVAP